MTPFGLRNRLRGLLQPPPPGRVPVVITLPDGRQEQLSATPGERAWTLACKLPIYLNPPCAGGRCGGCVILDGDGLPPMAAAERAAAEDNTLGRPLRAGERLGCHVPIEGPARFALAVGWTLEDLPELA